MELLAFLLGIGILIAIVSFVVSAPSKLLRFFLNLITGGRWNKY